MRAGTAGLVLAAIAAIHGGASAEVVTTTETQLTLVMPGGWRQTGVAITRFHPGVTADVITARGAEVHVFLSANGCPRPAGAAWTRSPASLLSEELDVVWQSKLQDVEQGCHATRRGELVIIVAVDEPGSWERAASQQLSDALVEAANGPMVSTAVAEARLRATDTSRRTPLALSVGAQVTRVANPDDYRNAAMLYDVVGRLGVYAGPVVARLEGKVGRASTSAMRLDAELTLGPALMREGLLAAASIGGAIGGQTASDADSFALPEDPIPVRFRIPIVGEAGKRLGARIAATGRVRVAWLLADDPRRQGGSPTLGSDELTLDARVYVGRPRATSFLVGLTYDEAIGARMVGVTIGLGAVPF